MSSINKHYVTVEDCVDEEDQLQQQKNQALSGRDEIEIDHINNPSSSAQNSSVDQKQAWEEVDALEEQARSEKLQDQSTAMANASETARIVKEAQQSSVC